MLAYIIENHAEVKVRLVSWYIRRGNIKAKPFERFTLPADIMTKTIIALRLRYAVPHRFAITCMSFQAIKYAYTNTINFTTQDGEVLRIGVDVVCYVHA